MSTIGRTFSVLNLVLAALFLGWAVQTLGSNQEYKEQTIQLEKDLAKAKEDHAKALGDAQGEIKTERTAKDQYKNDRDDSMASVDRLTADLTAEQAANAQLRAAVTEIKSTLQGIQQSKDDAIAAQQAAMEARHAAETKADAAVRDRDAAQLAKADAEKRLATAKAKIEENLDLIASLQSDVSKQETLLAVALDKTGLAVSDLVAQPYISSTVTKAIYDVQPGMVALQVGSSHGVKKGFTFEISRGATYKGRVKVTQVHDGMCSALITNLVPGQTIAQGDKAETNL